MAHKKISFTKLQGQINRHEFQALAKEHFPPNTGRKLSHWNHFSFWMYALVTKSKSLRSAVKTLNAVPEKKYHMGFGSIKVSTISEANTKRSHEFYQKLFFRILGQVRNDVPKKIKQSIRVLDSTTITFADLRFAWAKFRTKKFGMKVHVLLDQENTIPENAIITKANAADVKIAHKFEYLKGIIYVFDRAYTDFKLWRKIHENKAFFVIRAKKSLVYSILKATNISDVPGVLEKKTIVLTSDTADKFAEHLWLYRLVDLKTKKEIEVITNNSELTPEEVSEIYRKRWSIELFFKWIKQNLQIKRPYGFSENAVQLQIWLSMILYLLLWKMYHVTHRIANSFIDFLRIFTARLMLPIHITMVKNRPEPVHEAFLPGFPQIPTEH